MFCSSCGSQNDDTAKFCGKCGNTLSAASPQVRPNGTRIRGGSPTEKNPTLAVIISFLIAGGGQFYNGDVKKGAAILIGSIVGFFLTGGIATLAFWIWSMIDAYQVASGTGKMW